MQKNLAVLAMLTGCLATARAQEAQQPARTEPAPVQAKAEEAVPNGLIVRGTGEVRVMPDVLRVLVGVQHEGPDSMRIVQQNAETAQKVVNALRSAGIAEKDIGTTHVLTPRQEQMNRNEGGFGGGGVGGGGGFRGGGPGTLTRTASGYSSLSTIQFTVRKVGDLSGVLEAAKKVGANRATVLFWDVDEPTAARIRQEAVQRAVQDALTKAQAAAAAAKVTQVYLIGITEKDAPRNYLDLMRIQFGTAQSLFQTLGASETFMASPPQEQAYTVTIAARFAMAPQQVAAPNTP